MAAKTQEQAVRRFAGTRQGVDAVVQRIGRDTWDLILVDAEGAWDRWVFAAEAAARAAADAAGIRVHAGWTEELSQRVTRRDEWGTTGGTRRAL